MRDIVATLSGILLAACLTAGVAVTAVYAFLALYGLIHQLLGMADDTPKGVTLREALKGPGYHGGQFGIWACKNWPKVWRPLMTGLALLGCAAVLAGINAWA